MRRAADPRVARWHRVTRLLLAIVIAGLGAWQPAWSRARFGGFHFREPRIEHRQSFGGFGSRFHATGAEAHAIETPTRSRSALGAGLGEARANRQALDAIDAERGPPARVPLPPPATARPYVYGGHHVATNGFWHSLLLFAGIQALLGPTTTAPALAAAPPAQASAPASAATPHAGAELHRHAVGDIVLALVALVLIAFAVRRSLRVADANDTQRYKL